MMQRGASQCEFQLLSLLLSLNKIYFQTVPDPKMGNASASLYFYPFRIFNIIVVWLELNAAAIGTHWVQTVSLRFCNSAFTSLEEFNNTWNGNLWAWWSRDSFWESASNIISRINIELDEEMEFQLNCTEYYREDTNFAFRDLVFEKLHHFCQQGAQRY